MLPKRVPVSEICCVVVIACAIASGCDSDGSDDADVATSCFDQILESTWPEGRADLDASCAYTVTYITNLDVPDTLRFAGTYTRRDHILQFNRPGQDPFFASYNGKTAIFDLPGLSEAWVPTRPGAEKKPGIQRTESKSCTLPDDSFDLVRIDGSALPRFVISSRHEDAAITSGTLSFRDTRFDVSGQYEWLDRSNPSSTPRHSEEAMHGDYLCIGDVVHFNPTHADQAGAGDFFGTIDVSQRSVSVYDYASALDAIHVPADGYRMDFTSSGQ